MLKIYTKAELDEILKKHNKWLQNEASGERADLRSADLSYADLSFADLSSADLRSANLRYANLSSADLRSADLGSADLRSANLRCADLGSADLRSANLRYANLSSADLSYADLSYADLSYADLSYAKNFTMFYITQIVPQKGSFIGFKKSAEGVIIELEILDKAKRMNAPGRRKCRASAVKILKFHKSKKKELTSIYASTFKYKVGQVIKIKDFNNNVNEECGAGIHFFLTKEEAENYD